MKLSKTIIRRAATLSVAAGMLVGTGATAWSQESTNPGATTQLPSTEDTPQAAETSTTDLSDPAAEAPVTTETTSEKAKDLAADAKAKVDEVAEKIDQNEQAKEAAAGILQPIYRLAEKMAFPAFYWVAFTLMTAGVVSFAFQLVFGKLMVLFKGSLSPTEILSDAISLVISLVGLVLTTQAATENSTFTQSAAGVLSASLLGIVLGLFLYRWGQNQELRAAVGNRLLRTKQSLKTTGA